jgi:ferredoxin
MNGWEFFIDPSRCIGCKACMQACMECDTHRGRSMIHLEFVDRSLTTQTSPVVSHALRGPDMRPRLPRRCNQTIRRWHRAQFDQITMHRLLQLRACVSVRSPALPCGHRSDDEVRHVLRSHQHRQEAHVRHGVPESGSVLWSARRNPAPSSRTADR